MVAFIASSFVSQLYRWHMYILSRTVVV